MEITYHSTYFISRFLFQRMLAGIYLVAFTVAFNQFRALVGEHGILPIGRFLKGSSFWDSVSIFHWYYSDRFFGLVAIVGISVSLFILLGISEKVPWWTCSIAWFILWALYLSIASVGQYFYSFGWETLLTEVGFLAIFLGNNKIATPIVIIFLLRWVLFRLEFGAGMIKLRGDECWHNLTCLYYHYETQPMPNPVSWYVHHWPHWYHRTSVLFNHFVQLVVPWGWLAPQPLAALAGTLIIFSQAWLILTGNFAFLNFIALTLAITLFSDQELSWLWHHALPALAPPPFGLNLATGVLAVVIGILSINPIRNLISRHQVMNYSYDPLGLVGTYGAFGTVTKDRFEVILEGTDDKVITESSVWKEYEFKGKPGDVKRLPGQFAPYHLHLDWQMWFAALSPAQYNPWVFPLIEKLLENDEPVIRLMRHNPFPDTPPRFIRARLYLYRFTSPTERRETGAWWTRRYVEDYLPPLDRGILNQILAPSREP